jgi:7-cyano-7-deazaguanine tRNA-ribosyltransferase
LETVELKPPTPIQLQKLVGIANYQFGHNVGKVLFERGVRITTSRRTGRIRHIYRQGKLIATLRPKDGYLALTPNGAQFILSKIKDHPNIVVVQNDVAEFISAGGDVFSKHVVRAYEGLRPGEEAIVTDEKGALLGVGSTVLSGKDMRFFKRGVAVRIRKGSAEPKSAQPEEEAFEL